MRGHGAHHVHGRRLKLDDMLDQSAVSSLLRLLPALPAPRVGVERRWPSWAKSGLFWGGLAAALLAVWVLIGLGGLEYYGTPVGARGYLPQHNLLKPSGAVGETLGVIGALLMLAPFAYMIRKRLVRSWGAANIKTWLEVHIFCGIVGPVCVTFHTTFKFNGIVSAAYWSMVAVVLSGLVGRYLHARIPRSVRGAELTRSELDAAALALKARIADVVGNALTLERIETFERAHIPTDSARLSLGELLWGEFRVARRIGGLGVDLERSGLPPTLVSEAVDLMLERGVLLHRLAYLQQTKRLFDLWHVFHLPLINVLIVVVAVHVAVVLFLGYVPFRW